MMNSLKTIGSSLLGMAMFSASPCSATDFYPFPHVLDRNNFQVGTFLGGNGVLFLTGRGRLLQGVFFAQTGFTPPPGYIPPPRSFYYLSNDCSGQRYLDAYTPIPTAVVAADSSNFVFPYGTPTVTTFQSQKSAYDRHASCIPGTVSKLAAPAKIEEVGRKPATPPFSIVLH